MLHRLQHLKRFAVGDLRAPHKPLLLLFALGRLKHQAVRQVRYREAADVLEPLLRVYAPLGTRARTADPFRRLENDGIWRMDVDDAAHAQMLDRGGNARPSYLRDHDVAAGFSDKVLQLFQARPDLIDTAARHLLEASFPPDLHAEILDAVGLELGAAVVAPRSARFRQAVLDAYLHQCAVCGFSLRCRDALVGLDAAHIRWHAYGGPSEVSNGVALCSLHHRLFDLGVITISHDRQVRVADAVNGHSAKSLFTELDRQPLAAMPRNNLLLPAPDHLTWHHSQVFRGKLGG